MTSVAPSAADVMANSTLFDSPAGPLPLSGRVELIDTLRAMALFGVILMNIVSMVMFFQAEVIMARAEIADMITGVTNLLFLQGKARSCFAFLFGVGFGVMLLRAQAAGRTFNGFYWRRMGVLFVFGAINQLFLFWGDILMIYSLVGATLPAFRHLSNQALLRTAMVLVLGVPVLQGLWEMSMGTPVPPITDAEMEVWTASATQVLHHAPYGLQIVEANLQTLLHRWGNDPVHMGVYVIGILGLFLLGMWVARRGILFDVPPHRPLLRRIAWVALPVGFLLSLLNASINLGWQPGQPMAGVVTASYAGLAVMSMGYVALFALLLDRRGQGVKRLLAPVGRMALTNYLASGAIGALVYHGYGLGLMAKLSMAQMNVLALAVFALLVVFSHVWLRFFRQGPLEWLWRVCTYGRWQPLLRSPTAVTLPAAG